ncbi:putative serine-threonine protein kinase plant-type [Tripterygium wilfordii]|uniref:Putative serine-threonine protein kinase plant-type n=2 Tax=Tripterygium wilfordii TaxID=458696 RepID=A0A7J7CAL6_TRIWF|nr:putative serine-threonine protein kinase plant-type [Tripterygium wilfordii]
MSHVNLSVASDWLTVINSLPSLLELHLSECTLQVFPSLSSVNFTSLSILDLSWNIFHSAIPKWVFSLRNLISLDLSATDVEGPLPGGSWNLTSLKSFDVSLNYLNSSLPDWIFSLTSLVSLNLRNNGFEGPIPIGLHNLTHIRNLDLSENYFNSTIPDWLYNLESLQNLDLHSNNLQGLISAAIKNFTSVSTLDFSHNELEAKISKEMGNLCNLKRISVEGNKLGGTISEAFESLSGCLSSSLESLSLGGNNFSGHLPDKVGKFKHLRVLQLEGNLISGPIPSSLCSLSSLVYLDLAGNQLTGMIPECIGNLSKLERLEIGYNMLEGVLTEVHFKNLTSLRELYASNNHRLTLTVSPAWVPPFRLTALELRNWDLGTKFPLWLQSQDYFWDLDLSSTGIADSIPTWFWNITSRTMYLNLSHNQIGGELPADLRFSAQSTMIYLGSNKIKGSLPCITANVSELDLSNNSFSGTISRFLCNPKDEPNRLKILHLGENRLSGEIPDCWMKWKSLRVIKLGDNNLTGKVPISIGYLPQLQSLHLRNNSLSGGVPESLKNCSKLLTLDFGINKFVGSIPVWMTGSNLPELKVLGLRSNMLKGEIPPELCSLASLQILDVADNNLSGEIPKCVGNFKAMTTQEISAHPISYSFYYGEFLENAFAVIKGREIEYDTILRLATSIDMSNNDISGGIPEEVTALLGLRSLNLSRNRLIGPIPNKIGDMQVLESADLSINHLAGRIPPSMSSMHFLNYLNLSNNNLSGEIPLSTQLQSLDASSFLGNALCGPPLPENCSTERAPPYILNKYDNGSDGVKLDELYLSMVIGFVVTLVGVWGPLIYISSWRQAYLQFLDHMFQAVSGKLCK